MKWNLVFHVVFFQFLLLTECTIQYHYDTPVSVLRADGCARISGMQDLDDKDIILGGLLRVHKRNDSGKCGEIFLDKSLEHMEAVLFAIDLVNSDPHILSNITLGYDIRDTCISENIVNVPQHHLKLNPNITKQFGLNESGDVVYQLKPQCTPGFIKREVISSCCGTCDPCLGQYYSNITSSKECQICPQYMWGNNPFNGSNDCVDIEELYLKPSDGWSILLILLSVIGLLAVVFVSGVFIYFWNKPIVKSSGREQMILLLSGITLFSNSSCIYPKTLCDSLYFSKDWSNVRLFINCLCCIHKISTNISNIFVEKHFF